MVLFSGEWCDQGPWATLPRLGQEPTHPSMNWTRPSFHTLGKTFATDLRLRGSSSQTQCLLGQAPANLLSSHLQRIQGVLWGHFCHKRTLCLSYKWTLFSPRDYCCWIYLKAEAFFVVDERILCTIVPLFDTQCTCHLHKAAFWPHLYAVTSSTSDVFFFKQTMMTLRRLQKRF